VLWAFCVYVEAVSVAPQVLMMQRNRTVERFTGHYVFFLGISRFFSCAHWLLQMVDERNAQLWAVRALQRPMKPRMTTVYILLCISCVS
jgi:ER lumen protein retaining receptor